MTAPVPPIPASSLLTFLLQIGVLLIAAVTLGHLAGRLGMPAIVGELSAGVLLGPSLLGWAAPAFSGWLFPAVPEQMHMLDAVGQVAVLLLVGLTGIEMDARMLRRRGATVARIGVTGLIIPLGLGIALGFPVAAVLKADGQPLVFALFLGVAMCVSAIPVIAKMLADMNMLHRDVGQLTLAAGMVDDAFGWFMLSIVSALAIGGLTAGKISLTLLYLALVVLFAVVLGRPLVRTVLRFGEGSETRSVAVAAALILLAGAGTHALGLEAVFGAFICGILVGSSGPFARARTASLRTVVLAFLAPVFFATAGLRIDLRALTDPAVLAVAVAVLVVAIVGKFAGAYLGAWLSGLSRWESLALGAGMNARGVIEVIVAMVGLRIGVLSTASYTIIVLVAVVTSVMAPPLLRVAMRRIPVTEEETARRDAALQPASF